MKTKLFIFAAALIGSFFYFGDNKSYISLLSSDVEALTSRDVLIDAQGNTYITKSKEEKQRITVNGVTYEQWYTNAGIGVDASSNGYINAFAVAANVEQGVSGGTSWLKFDTWCCETAWLESKICYPIDDGKNISNSCRDNNLGIWSYTRGALKPGY
ncbi:MAG: hypothetical protein IKJ66_02130 [Bacteroidaceae bacterium]|nr:hypothetical protein [Bacteroidaceae bacterium]